MSKRESIANLAKTNFTAALKATRDIPEVGKRIQSLGWVARFAPDERVTGVVETAVKIAQAPADDAYEPLMALAWPLRALHETDNAAAIPKTLDAALPLAPQVTPTSSRAEAIGLLIHAVLPAQMEVANPAINALIELCSGDDHWRIVRAFGDLALMVNGYDADRALEIANAMPAGNKRDALIPRLEAGEKLAPRKFFW